MTDTAREAADRIRRDEIRECKDTFLRMEAIDGERPGSHAEWRKQSLYLFMRFIHRIDDMQGAIDDLRDENNDQRRLLAIQQSALDSLEEYTKHTLTRQRETINRLEDRIVELEHAP